MFRVWFKCVFMCLSVQISTSVSAGYYYTSHGGTNNNCRTAECAYSSCSTGKYLANCGGSSYPTSEGSCESCSGLPSNAQWTSNGGSDGRCSWDCTNGYVKNQANSACIPSTCNVPPNTYLLNSNPEVCTYECAAGYYVKTPGAPNSKGPSECEACSAGKFTNVHNSLTQCIPCAQGTASSLTASTACPTCTSNKDYAISTGNSACTACDASRCNPGTYLKGCGPNAAGECEGCTAS